ncbi:hypothetical protein D9753_31025 [Streptomyces dangxiongensis]|uniref:Uncharacterized protein n=1 Tax=Streptomyces dangxiongensis TaxID=1442032 RepID=A0A3G2JME2_9ACTN|nr:hypothetical protein [Streptomyces dangxiongensis]AYN42585.1 hypothetical protein D9753_31025 [Streptomyces dangxiongensis]
MTTILVTELDVLEALLAFDFIGFAQKSTTLDPADPHYGQAVGAAFALAVRRRFPRGAAPEEISGYVTGVLGSLEAGAEDFPPAFLEGLVTEGLYGREASDGGHADPETVLQARLLLTFRLVRELGLDADAQRELLTEAARRVSV